MGFFRRLFNRAKYQVSAGQTVWNASSKSGQLVNEKAALGLSALWCGIRTISQDLGCLEPIVYREKRSGTRYRDREHYLNHLFKFPNPEMTGIVFRECVQSHALLQTGGFAEIVRDGRGIPLEQYPIHPQHVMTYRDTDTGRLSYKITLATAGGPPGEPGKVIDLPMESVFYVPGLTPDGSIAYSLLTMARETIGFGLAAHSYGAGLFRNGVRPSGIIETPNRMDDVARENLAKSTNQVHAGSDNVGKVMILEEGLKFNELNYTNEQAQYKDLLNWFVYEVARLLVIPPSKLMSLEKATWGNLTELNRDYLNTTLRPWLEKWEAEIERKLLLPSEQGSVFVEFDTSKLLRADQPTRFAAYTSALAGKQWMTQNEVRGLESLPPIDGGDEITEPAAPVAGPLAAAPPADKNDPVISEDEADD